MVMKGFRSEFVSNPTVDRDAIVASSDAMPHHRFRAVKSHALPGTVPHFAPGDGPAVLEGIGRASCTDPVALEWCYRRGPLPA